MNVKFSVSQMWDRRRSSNFDSSMSASTLNKSMFSGETPKNEAIDRIKRNRWELINYYYLLKDKEHRKNFETNNVWNSKSSGSK